MEPHESKEPALPAPKADETTALVPVTELTITTGATEALFAALTALVHTGDEVLLFQPAYDSYVPAVRLSGGGSGQRR